MRQRLSIRTKSLGVPAGEGKSTVVEAAFDGRLRKASVRQSNKLVELWSSKRCPAAPATIAWNEPAFLVNGGRRLIGPLAPLLAL